MFFGLGFSTSTGVLATSKPSGQCKDCEEIVGRDDSYPETAEVYCEHCNSSFLQLHLHELHFFSEDAAELTVSKLFEPLKEIRTSFPWRGRIMCFTFYAY